MSDQCRECGRGLGAGYLCDECDGVALASPVTKRDALFWLAVAVATVATISAGGFFVL